MGLYSYKTEPLLDMTRSEHIHTYQHHIQDIESKLGKHYDLIIDGKRIKTHVMYTSLNPANKKEIIGTISQASQKEVDLALDAALKRFETWKVSSPKMRADVLFKAASIIRKRKFEFSAFMTKEAGKSYVEADADTAEAIDFLEYYGRQMLDILEVDKKVLSRRDIERNEFGYIPLGVGAIITP
jgi:1-pyrroline-5-carboxylate dehydrogenase